ncbi:MAG: quinol oxidase [Gammaproteobacteria bacterium]
MRLLRATRGLGLIALLAAPAPSFGTGAAEGFEAAPGPDGIQRVRVLAGSYFFRPRQVRVQAHVPVELTVVSEPGLIPHDFVIEAPKAGITVRETLDDQPRVIRFMPAVPGIFEFYCGKRLLFFESHKDKGMRGVLEVVP